MLGLGLPPAPWRGRGRKAAEGVESRLPMIERPVARSKLRRRKPPNTAAFKHETTQIASMAGRDMLTIQPVAQEAIKAMLGLADWFPFIVALTLSLLLSTSCFGVVQKAALRECVVRVPLATMLTFSTALETNNFVAHSMRGCQPL
jgi:hypothetical protein